MRTICSTIAAPAIVTLLAGCNEPPTRPIKLKAESSVGDWRSAPIEDAAAWVMAALHAQARPVQDGPQLVRCLELYARVARPTSHLGQATATCDVQKSRSDAPTLTSAMMAP